MINTDNTTSPPVTFDDLPAILIGGPPNAGKSVLTYNLTQELRRLEIPHYVFRASTDLEGDWFLKGNRETVSEVQRKVQEYRHWTDEFRALVCCALSHRYFPLLLDLGGRPDEKDICIFQACKYSILLLKDENKPTSDDWLRYTAANKLCPLVELRSQKEGRSCITAWEPTITGTIAGLDRDKPIGNNDAFHDVLERVIELFQPYVAGLETFHLDLAPQQPPLHLLDQLHALRSDASEWAPNMLQELLAQRPAPSVLAVYGRAPNWVYGALALHARTEPFYQFDALKGWITPPVLRSEASAQPSRSLIGIKEKTYDDIYIISIHPIHNYLDYETEAQQLAIPEPPHSCGVIVDGKLPLWLFTALARFYAQRNVPWIALNDAHENRPVVVSSHVETHPIGRKLSELPKDVML